MQRACHQRPNLNDGNRLSFVLCTPQAFPYRTFMPAVGGTIPRRGNCWTHRSRGTLTSPSKYTDLRFQHRPTLLTLCCVACHTIPAPLASLPIHLPSLVQGPGLPRCARLSYTALCSVAAGKTPTSLTFAFLRARLIQRDRFLL